MYGDPNIPKRKRVWDQLSDIAQSRSDLWFLTRDFNEIVDNSEKIGGPLKAEGSFVDFRSFLSASDMYALQHSCNSLSWRGMRFSTPFMQA